MDSEHIIHVNKERPPLQIQIKNYIKLFVLYAGVVFFITGLAKIISAFGTKHVLFISDPILGISFRNLMLLAGSIEIIIASICLFTSRRILSLGLVIWMSTGLIVYRIGLWLIGWQMPCSCMGNLTDSIGVPPEIADLIMKILLMSLFVGSGSLLLLSKMNSNRS